MHPPTSSARLQRSQEDVILFEGEQHGFGFLLNTMAWEARVSKRSNNVFLGSLSGIMEPEGFSTTSRNVLSWLYPLFTLFLIEF